MPHQFHIYFLCGMENLLSFMFFSPALFPPKSKSATDCACFKTISFSQNKLPFPSPNTMVKRLPLGEAWSFQSPEFFTSMFSKATSCSLSFLFCFGFSVTHPQLLQGQEYGCKGSHTFLLRQFYLNGRWLMSVTQIVFPFQGALWHQLW